MKIGIHSMVFVGDWSKEAARRAISGAAESGYDYIELAMLEPDTFDAESTRKLLEEYGIGCTASMALAGETNITSEDSALVEAGRKSLRQALGILRDCGGDTLCGVLYGALQKYQGRISDKALENSLEVMGDLADEAKASGMSLSLEIVNRYESNLLNTTQQCLDYLEKLGRDNVTAHLDTYHMNIEERSAGEAIKLAAAAGKLGYFHIGESNRGHLGEGSVHWDEVFSALKEVDYQGYTAFESFSSAVVHRTFSDTLAIWRDLWSDPMELATHARGFIKEGLGV